MWFRFVSGRDKNRYSSGLYQDWLVRPVNRIGRVKHGVYWCIYACIWRMSMRCESNTHGVYYGVISVLMYQYDVC